MATSSTAQAKRDLAGAQRERFLVCPPAFYDAHFLFNEWSSYKETVHHRVARHQWKRLVRSLRGAGAVIEALTPSPVSGAQVFTADLATVFAQDRVLLLCNDGPRGRVEPAIARRWFESRGFAIETLPQQYRADGGNLLPLHDGSFLAGLKPGATGKAEHYISRLFAMTTGARVRPVGLVLPKYLHIDMAVGRLGDRGYLVFEDALFEGRNALVGSPVLDREVIQVTSDDAQQFACNVITVGDVVITGDISRELGRRISSLGFWVERLPLTEFYKAGGGAKCLTLALSPIKGGRDETQAVGSGSEAALS